MGIQAGREGQGEAGGYWVKKGDASSVKLVPAGGGEGRRRRVVGEARAAGGKKGVAAVAKRKVGERRRVGKEAVRTAEMAATPTILRYWESGMAFR